MGLLGRMVREEWRMHSSIFGSLKFSLFPLAIFVVSLITFFSFDRFGFSMDGIQFGMHYVMLFFGLNVGVIGFVSRSSMRNLLGENNLLIFSSRFLPLSKIYILSVFILKDFLFYSAFFILPVVVANIVLTSVSGVVLLAFSYFLSFVTGLALTFFLTVLYVRISRYLFMALSVAGVVSLYLLGFGLRQLNPGYLFYLVSSPWLFFFSFGAVSVILLIAAAFYGFDTRTDSRERRDMYSILRRKLPSLGAKNILDMRRSTGGFGKIIISFLVLGLVFWFMVEQFPPGRIFRNAKLLTFSTFLGIASLSIYNWLNRYDRGESYTILPLERTDVLRNKVRSFYLISMPLMVLATVAGYFVFDAGLYELLHSFLVMFFSSTYILAVVVKLTGMKPNVMLLDASVVARFIALCFLVLEPLLIVGIIFDQSLMVSTIVLSVMYLVSGAVSSMILSEELDL